jgi:D-aspartate ligase
MKHFPLKGSVSMSSYEAMHLPTNMNALADQFRGATRPIPVVLEASGANGLGIIRGLGMKGIRSIALSSHRAAYGSKSRYATPILCPNPKVNESGSVVFMLALGRSLPQKGVLFLTDDTYLAAVSRNRSCLEKYYVFPFSDWDTIHRMMDKKRQYETAAKVGISTPKTVYLSELTPAQANQAFAEMTYPAILKGRLGKSFNTAVGRQVLVVRTPAEAESSYKQTEQYDPMLQEIIPGGDDYLYTIGSYISADGTGLGLFAGRKLRQRPRAFGTCRAAESLVLPELTDNAVELLRVFEFHGVSQVEFKKDPRDGEFKLIEINARYWLWHSLATACGVNLAYLQYTDALGERPSPVISKEVGKKWYFASVDLPMSVYEILTGRLSIRTWLSSLSPNSVDAVISLKDPLPAFMIPVKLLRGLRRKLFNRP